MAKTQEITPTSVLRLGHARCDVTPPVGIYHRMWGAARHDRAEGVHRPILVDILILEPHSGSPQGRVVRVQTDFVGLTNEQQDPIRNNLAERADIPADRLLITHSHAHASGLFHPDRRDLPGGELIESYLRSLDGALGETLDEAIGNVRPTVISYALGRCSMAASRDFLDDERGLYVTGYNPEDAADDTVAVGRVTDRDGCHRLSLVHYGCHPTTLAWENTLLSPDFVGATREVVEAATGGPCVYFQAPCGDLGPRDGFTGDLETADRNGRQLGYAAMSALSSLGPPETDFVYEGPVVSGATLGVWRHEVQNEQRRERSSTFEVSSFVVDLPLIDLPTTEQLEADLVRFSRQQREADEAGDVTDARDLGARAERCRRWLGRIADLPDGGLFPLACTAWRLGDAVWVTCGGEPYSQMQTMLRARFPDNAILVTPLATDCLSIAYLLPKDHYGIGLYQEEPSSLAPGCLETLTEVTAEQIACLLEA